MDGIMGLAEYPCPTAQNCDILYIFQLEKLLVTSQSKGNGETVIKTNVKRMLSFFVCSFCPNLSTFYCYCC